jgi:SanA protein
MRRLFIWGVWVFLGIVLCIVAALILVERQTAPYIFTLAASTPTTTAAVVLGASVYKNGTLSPVLKQRADRALELYQLGKVHKVLVTGDNSEVSHNEVNPVGKYLEGRGVPKQDIFLDHAGFDTYSSMYRAKAVFAIRSMTIVSQPFHLARAVFIARMLGVDAYGSEAGEGEQFVYNTWREVPATIKALIDLMISRSPQYLGPQFPIEGDGSNTWE